MATKKTRAANRRTDPDDAPPLDRDWFELAEIRDGGRLIRKARPSRAPRRIAAHPMVELRSRRESVIIGTDISVYVIAGLAAGQTVAEIVEDYPSLTRGQAKAAIASAKAHPKRGRPYPARTFKRMLGDLGRTGIEPVRLNLGPRIINLRRRKTPR